MLVHYFLIEKKLKKARRDKNSRGLAALKNTAMYAGVGAGAGLGHRYYRKKPPPG